MPAGAGPGLGPQSASSIYQHLHDMSAKRVSTLGYLRNVRTYMGCPLASRLSLPPILDAHSTPMEYLRALHALLLEFETFQQVHNPDGNFSSNLVRARLPQMFKRATYTGNKARRASSANEIGLPMHFSDSSDVKAMTGNLAFLRLLYVLQPWASCLLRQMQSCARSWLRVSSETLKMRVEVAPKAKLEESAELS